MSRCLRRQALFLVSQGEGLPWQRSHLMRCTRCAERYREMVDASELAARVLREGPLPQRAAGRRRALRPWPVAALAATGFALALVWRSVPIEYTRRHAIVTEEATDDSALSLAHVSQIVFASDEFVASPDPDGTYLDAALNGEWPCEREAGVLGSRCDYEP